MGDTDATQTRQDVACADEILSYLDGEWGRDSLEYDVYSELYDMVGALGNELDEAKAENAKLREENQSIGMAAYELGRKSMADENAKLRSLCTEVAGILFNLEVDRCGLCDRDSVNHPCPVHTTKGGECLIKSELRELGIEVN